MKCIHVLGKYLNWVVKLLYVIIVVFKKFTLFIVKFALRITIFKIDLYLKINAKNV
jgi:hypothetical protein